MIIYKYTTVSEAVNRLQERGFTIDFNTQASLPHHPDDFEIVEVYRYEGESDPGDEAVVYGLQSGSGEKGILVTGLGYSMDSFASAILSKLHFRQE